MTAREHRAGGRRFLEHKRALARKYISEEAELRLLVRFAAEHGDRAAGCSSRPLCWIEFLASRPRSRPRSFNHLLGVVGCLLDWAVARSCWSARRCAPAGGG